jgi:hypothetical protein
MPRSGRGVAFYPADAHRQARVSCPPCGLLGQQSDDITAVLCGLVVGQGRSSSSHRPPSQAAPLQCCVVQFGALPGRIVLSCFVCTLSLHTACSRKGRSLFVAKNCSSTAGLQFSIPPSFSVSCKYLCSLFAANAPPESARSQVICVYNIRRGVGHRCMCSLRLVTTLLPPAAPPTPLLALKTNRARMSVRGPHSGRTASNMLMLMLFTLTWASTVCASLQPFLPVETAAAVAKRQACLSNFYSCADQGAAFNGICCQNGQRCALDANNNPACCPVK